MKRGLLTREQRELGITEESLESARKALRLQREFGTDVGAARAANDEEQLQQEQQFGETWEARTAEALEKTRQEAEEAEAKLKELERVQLELEETHGGEAQALAEAEKKEAERQEAVAALMPVNAEEEQAMLDRASRESKRDPVPPADEEAEEAELKRALAQSVKDTGVGYVAWDSQGASASDPFAYSRASC